MNLGTAAVAALATVLGLGGVSAIVSDDAPTQEARSIQLEDEAARKTDDADVLVAQEDDGDGDDTKGDDGTGGGDNTGDGDWTGGNDGTGGGDNSYVAPAPAPAYGGGGDDSGGGDT